jgi:hypothetical protein
MGGVVGMFSVFERSVGISIAIRPSLLCFSRWGAL